MTDAQAAQLKTAWLRGDRASDISRVLGISGRTLKTWRKALNLPPRAAAPKPVPSGFKHELTVERLSVRALCRKYKTSTPTIARWAQEIGEPLDAYKRAAIKKREVPADWFKVAPTMTVKQLQTHYGMSGSLVRRIAKDTKIRFVGRKTSTYYLGTPGPSLSELDKAAHYLRRFFRNVHRCDIKLYDSPDLDRASLTWGDVRGMKGGGAGHYYVDSVGIVANNDVLALAQSKGWRENA